MKRLLTGMCALSMLGCFSSCSKAKADTGAQHYSLVNIDGVGFAALESLRRSTGVTGSVELGESLLVYGTEAMDATLDKGFVHTDLPGEARPNDLRVLQMSHALPVTVQHGEILARRGRFVIIQNIVDEEAVVSVGSPLRRDESTRSKLTRLSAIHTVLIHAVSNDAPVAHLKSADVDVHVIDEINAQRWFADVEKLATFNRYTKGPGIAMARDWLVTQLKSLGGLSVRTEDFAIGSGKAQNIVATMKGTSTPDKWIIVGGHYDATSESPSTLTPGAEDNASGAAGVVEMARAFAAHPPAYSMVFVLFAGEEQGMIGSEAYAKGLDATGIKDQVKAIINMDMIGYSMDETYDVLLETGAPGEPFLPVYKDAAARFTNLKVFVSLNPWGSDHMPFIDRNMPAVLTIDNDYESYPGYHRTTDLPKNLALPMGEGILRMNVATVLLTMAGN